MALTDAALKAFKPRDKVYTVTDGRGLYVEVFPTGGVVWRVRYRRNGKVEKLTLGKYPALSLKNARLKRDEAASAAAMGESPAKGKQLEKTAPPAEPTVAEFAEQFFRESQVKARKNSAPLRRSLDQDILPFIGQIPMREVTAADLRGVIWRKKDQGFDAAAGLLRGLLKRLCDYAVTCGWLVGNPVTAIPMRHVTQNKPRDRALSQEEVRLFVQAVEGADMGRQIKLGLLLLLLTLARKDELRLARWEHVHFAEAEWHIPAENSKTGKAHIVYLSRQALEMFRELKFLAGGSELVMPGRWSLTRPYAHTTLNNGLKLAMAGKGLLPFTVHDLRRTGATLLNELGWNSDVVEKALNHTASGVRGVYNRAQYASQRREMLQAWADIVTPACC
jgi:integrase